MTKNDINSISFALICSDDAQRVALRAAIADSCGGAIYDFVSFEEFGLKHENRIWAGVIVDLRLIVKSSPGERAAFNRLEEFLPVMRLRVAGGEVSGIIRDQNFAGTELLNYFFKTICTPGASRKMRRSDRRNRILSLEWFRDSDRAKSIRTTANDVSTGGLFMVCCDSPEVGTQVSLQVVGVPDFLNFIVRWNLAWGVSDKHFPGVGLEICDEQAELWEKFITFRPTIICAADPEDFSLE